MINNKKKFNSILLFNLKQLIEFIKERQIETSSYYRGDMLVAIMQYIVENESECWIFSGVVDMVKYSGFLRSSINQFNKKNTDIFLGDRSIKKFNIVSGDEVECLIGAKRSNQNLFPAVSIISINGSKPSFNGDMNFRDMSPVYPNRALNLTLPNSNIGRIIGYTNLIGFGQRVLISSAPRSGKTTIVQNLVRATATNHPDSIIMILLVGERPEEVHAMKMVAKGFSNIEICYSTFDQDPEYHIQSASVFMERAKRYTTLGNDVVVFIDSMTRYVRSCNYCAPPSGRTQSGGVEQSSLQQGKRVFGLARNIEPMNDGKSRSLTIVATTLSDTHLRIDDVIGAEFQGTSNSDIYLSSEMAQNDCFPAIDINKSGTRRWELMCTSEEIQNKKSLHFLLQQPKYKNPLNKMQYLQELCFKFKTSDALFAAVKQKMISNSKTFTYNR